MYLHYLLLGIMMLKMSDFILDWFDIFILELQELYIPKPDLWEWIWCGSVLTALLAKKAMARNNVRTMWTYVVLVLCTAIGPAVYAQCIYFNDFYTLVSTRDTSLVARWLQYPIALLWYIFLAIALQVHIAEVTIAVKLIRAWSIKKSKEQ